MPVVGYGGLVGQVVEADKSSSVIRLVTDGQTKVGVTYGPAGAFATVTGEGRASPSPLSSSTRLPRSTRASS